MDKRVKSHVGDSFVAAAAAFIASRKFPDNRKEYGRYYHRLVTNENLATAGYSSGCDAELAIGEVLAKGNTAEAMDFAVNLLYRTKAADDTEPLG